MSWFETIVVQPIFNILMALYGVIPGNDFGVAVILFAVIVRLLMWPLIKKQLHQTKLQRQIQPELKKIKQKAAGDKQLEGQLMLELYRERGINPFAPLGVLAVQLPVFIALYQVIMMISAHRDQIDKFFYDFIKGWEPIAAIVADHTKLNETLFQIVDLTKPVIHQGNWYIPALILALVATFFQWYQSKQITPIAKDGKRLRDILKQSATSGETDQAEMSAALGQGMLKIIPVIALSSMVFLPIPGALLLFYAVSSIVAVWQQRHVLDEDVEDMEVLADTSTSSSPSSTKRAEKAVEAAVVERRVTKPVQKRRKGSKVR
ncbi:MAG: YidC/Oxa1 family membrane protein insertase [Candidatus Saccharimonadales bacterium]